VSLCPGTRLQNWTVIPVAARNEYMQALDKASVDYAVSAFTTLIKKMHE